MVQCQSFTEAAGAAAVHSALEAGVSFTAIVAGNDLLAIGAMEALASKGIRCPQDVSITGYNDVDFMRRLTPAFTTVRIPLNNMGVLAARTLLDWVRGTTPETGTQTLLPVEFMHRGTTAAVSDH